MLKRKRAKLSRPFWVSLKRELQPESRDTTSRFWLRMQFRHQYNSFWFFFISAERQNIWWRWHSSKGLCWPTCWWQRSENRQATRNRKPGLVYLYLHCGELWQATTFGSYTQNDSLPLVFQCNSFCVVALFSLWAMIFFSASWNLRGK